MSCLSLRRQALQFSPQSAEEVSTVLPISLYSCPIVWSDCRKSSVV